MASTVLYSEGYVIIFRKTKAGITDNSRQDILINNIIRTAFSGLFWAG